MRYLFIISAFLITVFFSACNNKNKQVDKIAVGDSLVANNTEKALEVESVKIEETPAMCGWKCYGLLGRVKSVKYVSGAYLEFNTDGNLTKSITVWELENGGKDFTKVTNTYSNSNKYSSEGFEYKIECKNNVRNEMMQGLGSDSDYKKFTFDKFGRIILFSLKVSFDFETTEYKYKNNTDLFPHKEIYNVSYDGDGDGSGVTASTFEYLKTDRKGNWTKRKVNRKKSEADGEGKVSYKEKTIIEKREISYF